MEMVHHHQQQQQQRCRPVPATPHRKKQEDEEDEELRRGPWTVDEDLTLINYVAEHGDGRWNALARAAGLKRTGKSCRLRWLNYLRPDVKRGDFTADEQMLILDLHSRWGNRWSKIAQQLPGRTDNEIKNYWRTRVQKHARQLGCDVDSRRFKDAIAYLWMPPRLASRQPSSSSSSQQKHSTKSSSSSSPRLSSALTTTGCLPPDDNNSNNRSPGRSSSDSSLTSAEDKSGTNDWIQQVADHHESFWFTAPALDNGGQFQDDLTGWVQGFSDHTLWSLDDLWGMQ